MCLILCLIKSLVSENTFKTAFGLFKSPVASTPFDKFMIGMSSNKAVNKTTFPTKLIKISIVVVPEYKNQFCVFISNEREAISKF